MANKPLNGVLKHVRKLAGLQSARLASDPELLKQFVASCDEVALTVLIERHGPMVLGVCRRALRCPADAEDATQATFLVFSRKAASIRKTASLASWLHGVALRVAARLKRERTRRQKRERASEPPATRSPADQVSWAEVQTLLDEELQSLPERYAAVLILCYLDGKTRDEAAKHLGLTVGALHGLLERGRKLLADRLTRRGLTLSAGLFGVALGESAASAALSSTQVLSTVQAASLFAAGQPVGTIVSAGVLTLSQQVLKGMLMTKLKLVSAALLCCVLSVSAIGFAFGQPGPDAKQPTPEGTRVTAVRSLALLSAKDSDEAFIKRLSLDLRGVEPTPAEIHFFVTSKEAKKREKLVDLFVAEREAKKRAEAKAKMMDTTIEVEIEFARKAVLELELKKGVAKPGAALPGVPGTPVPAYSRTVLRPEPPTVDIALLKTNLELAHLVVREKMLRLKAAKDAPNPNKVQIELLEIEVERARVLVRQAELALAAATQKKTQPK